MFIRSYDVFNHITISIFHTKYNTRYIKRIRHIHFPGSANTNICTDRTRKLTYPRTPLLSFMSNRSDTVALSIFLTDYCSSSAFSASTSSSPSSGSISSAASSCSNTVSSEFTSSSSSKSSS